MKYEQLLQEIGLTKSETKVYAALLQLGEAKKDAIVRKSQIASSKLYEVTDKLIAKGLLSVIVKNNVKHFKAAPPNKLLDLLEKKQTVLAKQKESVTQALPKLNQLMQEHQKHELAEMFLGWKGLDSLYTKMLSNTKKQDKYFVIGGSHGTNREKTERFYIRVGVKYAKLGIQRYFIFGSDSKEYAKAAEKKSKHKYQGARYLNVNFPTETAILNDKVAIIILTDNPIGILIQNPTLAESYKGYFAFLWELAEE